MKTITASTMLNNTLNDYNKATKKRKAEIVAIIKRRLENHKNDGLQLSKEYLKAADKFLIKTNNL